jgi:hypothetical protein
MKRPTPAPAEAEQSYRAAADLARGMGMRPELAECLAGLASVLRVAGRNAAADHAEAEACEIATDLASPARADAGLPGLPAL